MINNQEQIAESFSYFHDGTIVFEKVNNNSHPIWKIKCEYLAERIQPNFTFFWMKIFGLQSLEFKTWESFTELKQPILNTIEEITEIEFEILSVREEELNNLPKIS